MVRVAIIISSFSLAVSVIAVPISSRDATASPSMNMPMAVHFNTSRLPLPEIDRQRARLMVEHARAMKSEKHSKEIETRASSIPLMNHAIQFVAEVGVGSSSTPYSLLVDTSSSITWIGAMKKYVPTESSKSTGREFHIEYGSGQVQGTEYIDNLSLTPELTIEAQSIGVASKINGFGNIDGILGLGPAGLSHLTVKEENTVPTVVDNLFDQHKIPSDVFSLSFTPSSSLDTPSAELIFDIDSSKYFGALTYTPITSAEPASAFWGIDQSVHYGVQGLELLKAGAGVVDSGTTLCLLASSAFERYKLLTGAEVDKSTGMLTVSAEKFKMMKSVYFNIGGTSFELSPNAQSWPRALNKRIGGEDGKIYLIIADLGMEADDGFEFINGFSFLQRFYAVFDTTNKRVGFANTINTMDTTN